MEPTWTLVRDEPGAVGGATCGAGVSEGRISGQPWVAGWHNVADAAANYARAFDAENGLGSTATHSAAHTFAATPYTTMGTQLIAASCMAAGLRGIGGAHPSGLASIEGTSRIIGGAADLVEAERTVVAVVGPCFAAGCTVYHHFVGCLMEVGWNHCFGCT